MAAIGLCICWLVLADAGEPLRDFTPSSADRARLDDAREEQIYFTARIVASSQQSGLTPRLTFGVDPRFGVPIEIELASPVVWPIVPGNRVVLVIHSPAMLFGGATGEDVGEGEGDGKLTGKRFHFTASYQRTETGTAWYGLSVTDEGPRSGWLWWLLGAIAGLGGLGGGGLYWLLRRQTRSEQPAEPLSPNA